MMSVTRLREWDLNGLKEGGLRSADVSRLDLIVRWGGGRRLSGFLPVQSVYADIFVIEALWPDFQPQQLEAALTWLGQQDRTLGPGGQLDTISSIQRHMEQARFEITDVESLRAHYALTLRNWVKRLEQNHVEALRFVNEFTYRVWRLYMSDAAIDFESGQIGIYQVLATKRAATLAPTPMTRRHLYSDEARVAAASTIG